MQDVQPSALVNCSPGTQRFFRRRRHTFEVAFFVVHTVASANLPLAGHVHVLHLSGLPIFLPGLQVSVDPAHGFGSSGLAVVVVAGIVAVLGEVVVTGGSVCVV
eukprot:TRINITY_DN11613_c0_g1_i3.p4 TRINITY_DN11613_c0_g1~~TRINITY_DN11613_c0_g1_i3.p4  ORF type:complete len:104 (-),score=2.09 TRINITY_DN11613_c0_g1_i3:210-521(-)